MSGISDEMASGGVTVTDYVTRLERDLRAAGGEVRILRYQLAEAVEALELLCSPIVAVSPASADVEMLRRWEVARATRDRLRGYPNGRDSGKGNT